MSRMNRRQPAVGDLNSRVTIQTRSATINDRGAEVLAWTTLATVAAHVRNIAGTERESDSHIIATVTHEVTIMYRADVTALHRISWTKSGVTRILAIQDVNDFEDRKRWLVLRCLEVVDDGQTA